MSPSRPSQLALGLAHASPDGGAEASAPAVTVPSAMPSPQPLGIAPEWKDQQRLWGHSFHPMCSYLASFPAALAHAFIARYSRPGDVVLDPFSGRGTTPLQAAAEGRIGVGNDLNPFAHLLTAAKLEPPSAGAALTRIAALRLAWAAEGTIWRERVELLRAEADTGRPGGDVGGWLGDSRGRPGDSRGRAGHSPGAGVPLAGSGRRPGDAGVEEPLPAEVLLAFHPATLAQLLFVRSSLSLADPTDRFLGAAISGILHGKSASYLSEVMPNTFSMAPRYVRDFIARTGFSSPARDVFEATERKVVRLFRQPPPPGRGVALLGDARDAGVRARDALRERALPARARLVVTSPPYLRVVKYGYYNWLRTWFLGFDAGDIDRSLDDAHHREPYLAFVREVLAGLRPVLADDAIVVLVVGDVELDRGRRIPTGRDLARQVWEAAAGPEGYGLAGVVLDDVAPGRKMTKLWGDEAGRATKMDRILVLGATEPGRRRALSAARLPVDWTWPPRALRAV